MRVDMRVSNRVVDLVEEGVDVALRVRPTLEDSGSLVVKNLGLTQTLLVGSPAQLARQGRPARVEDLARLDTVSHVGRGRPHQLDAAGAGRARATPCTTSRATWPTTC
ncbi:MAG: LysR substrate-binding domain-containing protein [Gemmatimonadales bacterium]